MTYQVYSDVKYKCNIFKLNNLNKEEPKSVLLDNRRPEYNIDTKPINKITR